VDKELRLHGKISSSYTLGLYLRTRGVKGIVRPFCGEVESMLIGSVMISSSAGNFFDNIFKGTSSQDKQKSVSRRLVISSMTLTGHSNK
jgi:hypothetical protein